MYLKNLKPVTPSARYKTKFIWLKNCVSKLNRIPYKSLSGRNTSGKLVSNSKGPRKHGFTQLFSMKEFKAFDFAIMHFNTNKKTKNSYLLYKTFLGIYFLLPAVRGNTVGSYIKGNDINSPRYSFVELGMPCFLAFVPYFVHVCNLFYLHRRKFVYSTSSGVFCVKLRAEKKEKLIKIKLPSEEIKFFRRTTGCLVGENYQNNKNKLNPGKAGTNIHAGWKPCVRGVAKNPVDHPNGGRTKSCKPELSPWGWVAKKNK